MKTLLTLLATLVCISSSARADGLYFDGKLGGNSFGDGTGFSTVWGLGAGFIFDSQWSAGVEIDRASRSQYANRDLLAEITLTPLPLLGLYVAGKIGQTTFSYPGLTPSDSHFVYGPAAGWDLLSFLPLISIGPEVSYLFISSTPIATGELQIVGRVRISL